MSTTRERVDEEVANEMSALVGRPVWDKSGNLRGRISRVWAENGRVRIAVKRVEKVPKEPLKLVLRR